MEVAAISNGQMGPYGLPLKSAGEATEYINVLVKSLAIRSTAVSNVSMHLSTNCLSAFHMYFTFCDSSNPTPH